MKGGAMAQDTIVWKLFQLKDDGYRAFQAKLVPTIPADSIIGVRMPALRKCARTFAADQRAGAFLHELPHRYYEENMLHALLVNQLAATLPVAFDLLDAFLPYVDNWAVCDALSIEPFSAQPHDAYPQLQKWLHADHAFTVRFAINMLRANYLDDAFDPEILALVAGRTSSDYYVNMARAWFFAEALIKQYDASIPLFTSLHMDAWTHNKSLQKARESYRLDDATKAYLQSLKVAR